MSTGSFALIAVIFFVLIIIIALAVKFVPAVHDLVFGAEKEQVVAYAGGEGDDDDVLGAGYPRLFLSDPDYTSARLGKKTIDARACKSPFSDIKLGDVVTVVRARPQGDTSEYPGGEFKFWANITAKKEYANIKELLKEEGSKKVYPDHSEKEAIELFNKYLPKDSKPDDRVIAFHFTKLKEKPLQATNHNHNHHHKRT